MEYSDGMFSTHSPRDSTESSDLSMEVFSTPELKSQHQQRIGIILFFLFFLLICFSVILSEFLLDIMT